MKSEIFYIDFLLDCVRKIENSTSGIIKEMFLENQEKQSMERRALCTLIAPPGGIEPSTIP